MMSRVRCPFQDMIHQLRLCLFTTRLPPTQRTTSHHTDRIVLRCHHKKTRVRSHPPKPNCRDSLTDSHAPHLPSRHSLPPHLQYKAEKQCHKCDAKVSTCFLSFSLSLSLLFRS